MPSFPIFRLPWLKKAAVFGVALLAGVLLLAWLALPRIIHWQAEKFIAAKTGHQLVMERPEFNPFQLALRLGKLRLSTPEGAPLLAFDGLLVDVAAASITQRALVFDAIRLDGLTATLVELPAGRLNWSPFLDALKGGETQPEAQSDLPRLDIRSFVLAGGAIDYADRRRIADPAGFATRVEPLDLQLTDLSTLPDDTGKYSLSARTSLGARIELLGTVDLDPLVVAGTFSLADLQLAKLAPYLKHALPVPPEGLLGLSASYRVGNGGDGFDATVEQIQARLSGLRVALKDGAGPVATVDGVELKDGSFRLSQQTLDVAALTLSGGKLALPGIGQPPQFGALAVEDVSVALGARTAAVGRIALSDGRVQAVRQAAGGIDLLAAFKALSDGRAVPQKAGQSAPPAPWRFKVGRTEIARLGFSLRDAGVTPAFDLTLDNVALQVDGVSDDMMQPLPFRLSFDARSGGRFDGEGRIVPAAPAADVSFKLSDFALQVAQPYLGAKTTLTIAGGKLATQGRARYDDKGPHVKGEFAVSDLRLMEPGTDKPLLAWKTFASRDLEFTDKQIDFGELRLGGLDTQLIIDKDKSLNLKRVMKPGGAEMTAGVPAEKAPAEPGAVPPAPTFIVNIDRLRFYRSELDFADHSLMLPFGTRIHELRGSIAGLSNRPGAVGQIELDGAVDDYGMARAVGHVNLGNPTDSLDMRVQFRNVEMTRLTPYTATFAGRRIDSGKLSLDLQYRIKQRQLQGDNQVVMDKLVLGERVESPTAKSLPLDLAIAILQDSAGRIDLGLPVSGSLDDPEFSYGAIVWKAITNVLTKIVTAPFRALGALFGGGESVENIVFEAGASRLTPPEREKLVRLAEAMGKRPGLVLAVGGLHAEADRIALQEVQLRRVVLTHAGQRVTERGDPGPVSTQQPKIQDALEALYKERFGASDLAALKEGFRSANPGQLEESMTGKVMSRLSGLLREKKTLSESEVVQLKGADFHGVLFERLRAREEIAAERLQALARQRGESAMEILAAGGVAAERLQLLPPGPTPAGTDAPRGEIPLRMMLEPAKGG